MRKRGLFGSVIAFPEHAQPNNNKMASADAALYVSMRLPQRHSIKCRIKKMRGRMEIDGKACIKVFFLKTRFEIDWEMRTLCICFHKSDAKISWRTIRKSN